ncbi:MAG: hypothetical protein Q7T54_06420 [Candidatus Levybacteria bacterium]|nr:hypothetical protein [Candidatus Levybacteria bacterium]
MRAFLSLINLNKRQKFVLAVLILSVGVFMSEYFSGLKLLVASAVLAVATVLFLLLILRKDIKGTFFGPILILPFFFTLAFPFFYALVPERLLSRLIITIIYAFGLYSLFLTQNIFAVSGIRTINLLRSARIVAFVITLLVFYFLVNFVFSLRLPVLLTPLAILPISFFMNIQSLWTYTLDTSQVKAISLFSFIISLCILQLSYVLILWPVNASIYSLFLTGIFYTYSGLCHAWLERRLFKGILWEYVWVGFISVLFLVIFSKWGV